MKKVFIVYMCLISSVASCEPIVIDADTVPIQEQTFLVYRRYYFIARLDKTIKLLAKMYQEVNSMQEMLAKKKISFEQIVPNETYKLFTHKQIRRSVKEITHTKSFKPLFMVWDSFKSYKSLHDDLLVEDFSKEIFIITHNTINKLDNQLRGVDFPDDFNHSLEERFDLLSDMTRILEDCISGSCNAQVARNPEMSDIHMAIQTDEVAHRFYCIHRLRKAYEYLLRSDSADMKRSDRAKQVSPTGTMRVLSSFRQRISVLWDDLTQYKYISNERFVHDFASLTLTTLRIEALYRSGSSRITQADIIAIHHQIEQLPLEEILQAIDLVVKQVNAAVDHYHKSGLTVGQWIKQYWWVPPVVIATFAAKSFLLYFNNFESSS